MSYAIHGFLIKMLNTHKISIHYVKLEIRLYISMRSDSLSPECEKVCCVLCMVYVFSSCMRLAFGGLFHII